jgi:hypothetical protein
MYLLQLEQEMMKTLYDSARLQWNVPDPVDRLDACGAVRLPLLNGHHP